jgi:hypothetical protein
MTKSLLFFLGALTLAVIVAWFSAALAYGFGSRVSANALPLAIIPFGIAVGFLALAQARFPSRATRTVMLVVYVPISLGICWFTSLLTACSFGDCI